jgi:hypothetical protein
VEPTSKNETATSPVVDDFDVPLGLAEVGDLFGVAEGTTSKWHWRAKRGDFYFPKPDGYVSRSTPYWWESTMLAWGREVGRKTAAEVAAEAAAQRQAIEEAAPAPLEAVPEPVAVG